MVGVVQVVGAVIVRDGSVLACRRAPDRTSGGLWEFPGGKVWPGEDPRAALVREIREELGVAIEAGELIDRTSTAVRGAVIDLACYRARLLGPAPLVSVDHDRLAWLTPRDLPPLPWSQPDLPTVAILSASPDASQAKPPG